jgi:hypothetical protein
MPERVKRHPARKLGFLRAHREVMRHLPPVGREQGGRPGGAGYAPICRGLPRRGRSAASGPRLVSTWSHRAASRSPGKIVISPGWIKTVSWDDSRVYVDLLRREVETAPEYDSDTPLERALESGRPEHYCRPTH